MKCSICGKESTQILSKNLRRGKGTVYYCPDCDYGMLQPVFQNASEYYNEEYRKKFKDVINTEDEETPEEIYEMRKEYQNDRVNIIKKYFNPDKTFLEIGCSAGMFINQIMGSFKEVEAVELSKKCAEFVRNKWGIKVFDRPLQELEISESYDYIAFFQVLEHIENPLDFMCNVREHTKNNGRVFIEIPNLYDPLRVLWKVPAYQDFYYHEAHVSYFSKHAMEKLLKKAGWEIEEVYYMQDYNLLNHLYWYFNNMPQATCEFGLNQPHIEFQNQIDTKLAGEEINNLFVEINKKYFQILSKYKLTSNMFFVAK